jgi:hypothetical protein
VFPGVASTKKRANAFDSHALGDLRVNDKLRGSYPPAGVLKAEATTSLAGRRTFPNELKNKRASPWCTRDVSEARPTTPRGFARVFVRRSRKKPSFGEDWYRFCARFLRDARSSATLRAGQLPGFSPPAVLFFP